MKKLPIRWKFALWAAALVGIVLLVYSGGTLLNLYREELESVDLSIEAESHHLAQLSDDEIAREPLDALLRYQPWVALAVFDEQGRITKRSERLPENLARGAVTEVKTHTGRVSHGEAWRLQAFKHGPSTIVVAETLEEVSDIMRDLMWSYLLSLPVVLFVAAFGGWWVAGRALAPLRTLTGAAESIRADLPQWRVPADESAARDEIRRLTDVLNATLTRLEKSFQQAQRFAADASHELRTPLTIIHGEIERLIRLPGLAPAAAEKLVSLQEELLRLDRITEHLLLLARFDAGNVAMQRDSVNFSKLVVAVAEDAELLSAAHEIKLEVAIAPDLTVTGDAAHLRRAVLALLDNAVRYNHTKGLITCVLEQHGERVELRVRNTGPGIPGELRGQLFQRFFRADSSRARGGHGLGLSLAREIARAHGGDITLGAESDARWTAFVLTLPSAALRTSANTS